MLQCVHGLLLVLYFPLPAVLLSVLSVFFVPQSEIEPKARGKVTLVSCHTIIYQYSKNWFELSLKRGPRLCG